MKHLLQADKVAGYILFCYYHDRKRPDLASRFWSFKKGAIKLTLISPATLKNGQQGNRQFIGLKVKVIFPLLPLI